MRIRLLPALFALTLLAACGGKKSNTSNPPRPAHTIHGCSPFVQDTKGGACVTPFPNSWFEEANAQTATGIDVRFPDGDLPSNTSGVPVKQKSLGVLDGYSPATPIVVWLPNGVDATQLTKPENIQDSLSATNPIVLVDLAAKTRVPFFSEVDANNPGMGRHALLIHPMVRLKFSSRYAVAITTALKDGQGNPLQPTGDFALWVQGKLTNSSPLAEIADRLDADAQVFSTLGIPKSSLALAWDFDTASDAATTGPLIGMVNEALQSAPKGLAYAITNTTTDASGSTIITGTFQSPSFETGPDSPTNPPLLNYDANGKPIMGSPANFPFTALIPPCVATQSGPVPLVIVGHGIFGSAASELTQSDENLLNQLCMVGLATDFLGVTDADYLPVVGGKVLPDINNFGFITDRLMQAHVNFQILTRLGKNALASDAAFQVNGKPSYDPSTVYYWGASNGGIQGFTYLALSPDVDRGLLNVPGAEWSLLLWRSNELQTAAALFNMYYPDILDQQIDIAVSQWMWDKTDPIEFVSHIPATKHVLFQESIGDPLVSNITTELEMRTLGVKVLAPLINPVFGLDAGSAGPLDGFVYTQWSINPTPFPGDTDVPPQSNDAHGAIRVLPQAIDQMKQFLQPNGMVVNTCGGGKCVYPDPLSKGG